MGLSEYNRLRAIAAEKAKLEAQAVKPITEPAPVEILEKIEPVETAEIIEVENKTPEVEACETKEVEKPKKKTDAEKLKRKK